MIIDEVMSSLVAHANQNTRWYRYIAEYFIANRRFSTKCIFCLRRKTCIQDAACIRFHSIIINIYTATTWDTLILYVGVVYRIGELTYSFFPWWELLWMVTSFKRFILFICLSRPLSWLLVWIKSLC